MNVFDWVFLISCLLLVHAYWGYSRLLRLLVSLSGKNPGIPLKGELRADEVRVDEFAVDTTAAQKDLSVTVMLTVHNEQATIGRRLRNLLASEFDSTRLQVLVCSDGSTDGTETIVKALALDYPNIELFSSGERLGKTGTQNRALPQARGDILVFTDADTEFAPACLQKLVAPFSDSVVGGTTGSLYFRNEAHDGIATGQQSYWSRELAVRSDESKLGWLCVATGACMAIRRKLYSPPSTAHGEDCVLPLDVVLSGHRMVHVSDAVAFDEMPADPKSEFRVRVRMTERNWTGTLSRAQLLNPFRYPYQCFSLISHKLLKWLSPVLLLIVLSVSVINASNSLFYSVVLLLASAGFVLSALGALTFRSVGFGSQQIPLAGTLFGFAVANAGFAVGGLKALVGVRTAMYSK